jgi:hypothetical protein
MTMTMDDELERLIQPPRVSEIHPSGWTPLVRGMTRKQAISLFGSEARRTLLVDIFEGDRLVITHIFYGRDVEELVHIYRSHKKADSFLRQCINYGCYESRVPCRFKFKFGWA